MVAPRWIGMGIGEDLIGIEPLIREGMGTGEAEIGTALSGGTIMIAHPASLGQET